jgi:hypothetical protein
MSETEIALVLATEGVNLENQVLRTQLLDAMSGDGTQAIPRAHDRARQRFVDLTEVSETDARRVYPADRPNNLLIEPKQEGDREDRRRNRSFSKGDFQAAMA